MPLSCFKLFMGTEALLTAKGKPTDAPVKAAKTHSSSALADAPQQRDVCAKEDKGSRAKLRKWDSNHPLMMS